MLSAVAHQARLDQSTPDGSTVRAYEDDSLAKIGRRLGDESPEYAEKLAEIDGPDMPDELGYLLAWSHELYGRSGVSQVGVAPLSWETVRAWRDVKAVDLMPHEADALMQLDAVRAHPPEPEVPETEPVTLAWPEKNADG